MRLENLLHKIDDIKDDVIGLASDLTKIPSVNPPGNVTEISEYIKDFLEGWGLSVKWLEPAKGKVNLITSIGEGGEMLMLNGHVDVVPPGDQDKWSIHPFSGKIIDGYLYGRGASDMKGALASLLYAFVIMASNVDKISKKLIFATVPDEETGGEFGAKYLVFKEKIRPDYVLIGEPSTLYATNIGEKGILWIRLTVVGRPGHASLSPYIGDNAIIKALNLANKIYDLVNIDYQPPEDLREIADKSGKLMAKITGVDGLKRIFKCLSCNIGLISGGVKTNIIAPSCMMEFDLRIPHGTNTSSVKEVLNSIVAEFNDVKIDVIEEEEPNYTSPKSKIVNLLTKAVMDELGSVPEPTLISGATDGRIFRSVGSDVIIYGPAEWEGVHGFNERIKVKDIIAAAKIYLRLLHSYIKE